MKKNQMTNNPYAVSEIMEDLELALHAKHQSDVQRFKKKYSTYNTSDIQWCDLCQDAKTYGCLKFAFLLMLKLLEAGLYHGEYEKELYDILPTFQQCAAERINSNVRYLLCENQITDLFVFVNNNKHNGHFGYAYIQSRNPYIKSELVAFMEDARMHNRWHTHAIIEAFKISLGNYASEIHDHTGFTDITFWKQIKYYKKIFPAPSAEYTNSIRAVCCFYRWLVNKYTGYPFFDNAFTMTKSLLFCSEVVSLIADNYFFMTYNPHSKIADHTKVCFILRNMDHLSTKMKPESHTAVDLSSLRLRRYRLAILSFINGATTITTIHGSGHISYAIDALTFYEKLKRTEKYPNPDPGFFTTQEAVLVRNYCNDENLKLATRNNRIGAVRRFLQWCEANSVFSFEATFFDYLRQYEEPSKTSGHSIPDEDLAKLSHYLHEHASESVKARLTQTAFHLAIQTEFRISQILHLTTDCIRPSLKAGEYVVHSNSKTSHGVQSDYVITELTFQLLMDTIEFTESLRASCNIEALKNYIFLYPGVNNAIHHFNSTIFRDCLNSACRALELPKNYTASDLRDTHMTKALEHILRNGKSDIEMGLLSKHKHLDTTKNHYIELELEKMLEATYGITIGSANIDATSKIVDHIPDSASSAANDVEYGCGKCTAPECIINSSLPCMVCKYFVTTVDHAPFFERAIENVDRMISAAQSRHDIEDLVVIKNLYGAYLESIYRAKELTV